MGVMDRLCPDVDGRFCIKVEFVPDGERHTISCIIKSHIPSDKDGVESGEWLELKSFYKGHSKLSIGMEGETGYFADGTSADADTQFYLVLMMICLSTYFIYQKSKEEERKQKQLLLEAAEKADAARIREVLTNLLSNAVKFTKDGGTVTLDISSHPGEDDKHMVARYTVQDNGIGMSEEFQKNLFEPFSQEDDKGARTQYKGTGLGMAITKEYVHMMGGKIDVESKKGIGTTFTVEIPLELTEQDIHQKQEEPVYRDLTGVNVLMAEDNDLNAELATVMLEDAGMVVTRASDGKEAVERFKNHPRGTYDIILMDIMMPNMDGHQAAKTIRAMEKERPDASSIPIIALSANAFAEDVKASVDSGMNGHISKPFDMEEVTATIAKYVKL